MNATVMIDTVCTNVKGERGGRKQDKLAIQVQGELSSRRSWRSHNRSRIISNGLNEDGSMALEAAIDTEEKT